MNISEGHSTFSRATQLAYLQTKLKHEIRKFSKPLKPERKGIFLFCPGQANICFCYSVFLGNK